MLSAQLVAVVVKNNKPNYLTVIYYSITSFPDGNAILLMKAWIGI